MRRALGPTIDKKHARWLKVMDLDEGALAEFQSVYPYFYVWYRHYFKYQTLDNPVVNANAAFQEIMTAVRPKRQYVDFISSYNETGLWEQADEFKIFEKEIARLGHSEGLKVVSYNFSAQQPPAEHIAFYGPVPGDALGLNEYNAPTLWQEDQREARLGRHKLWREPARANWQGDILIGETGIDRGVLGEPVSGWRAPNHELDPNDYADQLRWLGTYFRDNGVTAAFVFNCGYDDWKSFELRGYDQLADAIASTIPLGRHPSAPITPIPGGTTVEFPFATTLYNSPNHNTDPDTTRNLIVIHSTRSGRVKTNTGQPWTHENEFDTTVGYMLQSGTTSADAVISPTRVGLMQPYGGPLVMWHGGYNNTRSRGYEICQAQPTTLYTDMQLRKAAWLVRQDCLRHGIPMKRIMDENQSGIIGHQDSAQGIAGGKSDPGALFDWVKFIGYVNDPNLFAPDPTQQYNILGFRTWLDAQPAGEYGAPRHDAREFGDGSGDLYVRLQPTPKHPDGPMLVYRKFWHDKTGDLLRAIQPVIWE